MPGGGRVEGLGGSGFSVGLGFRAKGLGLRE